MGKYNRKISKMKKRAGLGKKWWKRFKSEKEYKKAVEKWERKHKMPED